MMGLLLSPQMSLAACNWEKDIVKTDKGYLYPSDCHGEVGKVFKSNILRKEQIKELNGQIKDIEASKEKLSKSIELKDLALIKADEMSMRWREESYNQHERLLKQKRLSETNNWIYFIGGFLAASASVYAAGQIIK